MNETTRSSPPWTAVARVQLRDLFAGLRSRRPMIAYGLLFFLILLVSARDGFPAFVVSDNPQRASGLQFIRPNEIAAPAGAFGLAVTFGAALLVGFFLPFRVWRGSRPAQRDYFWSLPVDTRLHELLRVAAELLVLWSIVAVVTLVSGITILTAFGPTAFAGLTATAWASLLTAPTTLYLLNSIATLRSNRPALWLLGLYYPLGMGVLITSILQRGQLVGLLSRHLLDGPFSLFAATLGPFLTHAARPFYSVSTAHWPVSALLWIVLAGGGVVGAVLLRRR